MSLATRACRPTDEDRVVDGMRGEELRSARRRADRYRVVEVEEEGGPFVCRFCDEPWRGYAVVEVRPPDNGDPGSYGGKTLCCGLMIESDRAWNGGWRQPPEYARLTLDEARWVAHYEGARA